VNRRKGEGWREGGREGLEKEAGYVVDLCFLLCGSAFVPVMGKDRKERKKERKKERTK
jgi:hypothetical protein